MLQNFHLRWYFMPFFIAFIAVAVALSMGPTVAQTSEFGNLGAATSGYTPVCRGTTTGDIFAGCPSNTAIVVFSVPTSAPFTTVESITVTMDKDFFLGGSPSFALYLGEPTRRGTTVQMDEEDSDFMGFRTFPVEGPLTRDFTFSGTDLGNGYIFIPGREYGIQLQVAGLEEGYGGWRQSNSTPPTGIFDYLGSFAGNPLTQVAITQHLVFNLEVSPAVELIPASINVVEGGGGVGATLALNAAIGSFVQFPISADPQCEVSIDNLNFTTSLNLSIGIDPATFYVRAVDDGTLENAHACTVTTNTTSNNIGGNAIPGEQIPDLTVTITDNDTIIFDGITRSESGGNTAVAEGGATDSFSLRLDSAPTAPVQIAMLTDGQCSVAPNSLTFNTSSFFTAQNVTVTAVNDTTFEANPHSCAISFSVTSSDSRYNGWVIPTINASVADNDPLPPVGFITIQTNGSTVVSEAGENDSFSIRMTAPPNGNVTIVTTTDGQCDVNVSSLSFNNNNYSTPQTITVTAVNDAVAEGNHTCSVIYDTIIGDPSYTVDTTVVTVLDDDAAGFTLLESGGATNVTEGGATDSLTVRLNTAPTQDVTLALSTNGQCAVTPNLLTFNAATYDDVRTITVSAANDGVFEASPHRCTIIYDVITLDPAYINLEVFNTNVNVTDFVVPPPPAAGVTLTQTGGTTNVTEGGVTDTLTLRLNSAPAANVQIAVTTDAQCSAAPTPLTFGNTTFATEQTVTLTAVDDALVEANPHACAINFAVTSTDGAYNGLAVAGIAANVTDNDTLPPPPPAGVTLTQTGGTTDVTEGGVTDTLTLRLNSAPAANVQIAVTTDAQCSAAPTPLTFGNTTFATEQTVTLTAVDDAVVEANPHTCAVNFAVTSTDGAYNGLTVAGVTANVTDNDTLPPPPPAGVTLTQTGGTTDVSEGGVTDTLTLRLNSAPGANVQIAVTTDAQCSAAPTPLTFDNTTFAIEQTVTLTAVDDAVVEANPHTCAVSFAVTSTDGAYNGLTVAGVTANVTDNDTLPPPPPAGVTLTQTGGTTDVTEGGATDTLTLRLNSAPGANVQIAVTTDAQCSAAPTPLMFDNTTFAIEQTVTLTAVDDAVVEANPHTCAVSFAVTSTDGAYNGLTVAGVTASVTDNDTAVPPPPGGGGTIPPVETAPPPPPTPLCEDHNFSESGVVRTGIADVLRPALNCRVLYQNGAPTTWLNSDLYTSGSIGSEGVFALGVMQAIDIFSPSGLTYFNGGAVFCLRGNGYLIWLAASGVPRRAEIIGSYRVPEFPGFTCATLFEPGTLVLVGSLPEGVDAP